MISLLCFAIPLLWGNQISLTAAATAYSRAIVVIRGDGSQNRIEPIDGQARGPPIFVGFIVERHFVGLVPTLQGDPIDVLIAQSRLKGRRSGSQSAGRARRGKKNTALPTPVSASWC
jgi:hypothetical protein